MAFEQSVTDRRPQFSYNDRIISIEYEGGKPELDSCGVAPELIRKYDMKRLEIPIVFSCMGHFSNYKWQSSGCKTLTYSRA